MLVEWLFFDCFILYTFCPGKAISGLIGFYPLSASVPNAYVCLFHCFEFVFVFVFSSIFTSFIWVTHEIVCSHGARSGKKMFLGVSFCLCQKWKHKIIDLIAFPFKIIMLNEQNLNVFYSVNQVVGNIFVQYTCKGVFIPFYPFHLEFCSRSHWNSRNQFTFIYYWWLLVKWRYRPIQHCMININAILFIKQWKKKCIRFYIKVINHRLWNIMDKMNMNWLLRLQSHRSILYGIRYALYDLLSATDDIQVMLRGRSRILVCGGEWIV